MKFGRTEALYEVREKVAVMSFPRGDHDGVANASSVSALVPDIPSIVVIADCSSDCDENGQNASVAASVIYTNNDDGENGQNASVAASAIKVNTGNRGQRSQRW